VSNLYAERDIIGQGNFYSRHTSAMTGEGLHSKSDIAAELAHRDIQIEQLQEQVAKANTDRDSALDAEVVAWGDLERERARVAELESALQKLLSCISETRGACSYKAEKEARALLEKEQES
jgi:hypothetical protein